MGKRKISLSSFLKRQGILYNKPPSARAHPIAASQCAAFARLDPISSCYLKSVKLFHSTWPAHSTWKQVYILIFLALLSPSRAVPLNFWPPFRISAERGCACYNGARRKDLSCVRAILAPTVSWWSFRSSGCLALYRK